MQIVDSFDTADLNPHWTPLTLGTGSIQHEDGTLRFVLGPTGDQQYSDAQITDYVNLLTDYVNTPGRRRFVAHPPLRLTVRAWGSPTIQGTAGFGFWNEPFARESRRLPRLPRAAWFFFGSPPNNMALAKGVPGWGWKAATLDARRLPGLLLAPAAPLGFLLMRVPVLYRWLWPVGQWAIGVSEAQLGVDLADPHTYDLEWCARSLTFSVDGRVVHRSPYAPAGPLGFIAWIDNQYAVVTPQGRFKFGLLATTGPQWLALDRVEIRSL